MWIETLRSKTVVVTGDFRQTRFEMTRDSLHALLRKHGASPENDINWGTDYLIRAESPMWKYDTFGAREEELSRNQQLGRAVAVIDVDNLHSILHSGGGWGRHPMSQPAAPPVGRPYVEAAPLDEREAVLFEHDPAELERGINAHGATQNALAERIITVGCEPLSPAGSAARFDLAWVHGGTVWVAEVKSLTEQNQSVQLRLGLGQVLEYRWRLAHRHDQRVRAALVTEVEPTDSTWRHVAEQSGVVLTWAPDFPELIAAIETDT